jgi:hypothetical protein
VTNPLQYLYVCQVLYAFAIALTKIAIISSYLRFIQDRAFRTAMYVTSVIIAVLWVTGKANINLAPVHLLNSFRSVCHHLPVPAGYWRLGFRDRAEVHRLHQLSVRKFSRECGYRYPPMRPPFAAPLETEHAAKATSHPLCPFGGRCQVCIPVVCSERMLNSDSACVVGVVRIGYLHHLRVLDTTCK